MAAESQESRQIHHRASIKWLISKAFNNCVPDNLKEPFYRDHENQERLKPQIIVELGNATLYCQALSNLYSDPNYESLNHWLILQTLARKGVPVAEANGAALTETILRQTNPLKINAHISVIESLMILYTKEITSGNRIKDAIKRISAANFELPAQQTIEQSLLAWVSQTCAALKRRISKEIEVGCLNENGERLTCPDIPVVHDYKDLRDGNCLALLISYYCPIAIPWNCVRINYSSSMEDSIYNVMLVKDFCQNALPYNVFHLAPEDITYMNETTKLNLLVLLSDLFNLLEIHPVKCVVQSDDKDTEVTINRNRGVNEHGIYHRRGLTKQPVIPIPDLRSELESTSNSPTNRILFQGFVVHKSRGITTLSAMHHTQQGEQKPSSARLRSLNDSSNPELKDDKDFAPAGRPSNWEQARRSSFTGRRSRRNSTCDDSQLTIENFGGSQDQLNAVGQYERERERERHLASAIPVEPTGTLRSSVVDARGTLQLGYDTDSGSEKQDRDTEKYMHQQNTTITENLPSRNGGTDTYRADDSIAKDVTLKRKVSRNGLAGPSTTWKSSQDTDDDVKSLSNESTKLSNIRLKLEEKHRRIEEEKLQIELALLRHQEREKEELKARGMGGDDDSIDMESTDLDKYQQSIAVMNSNLQDIQEDIQKLANQQNQIQTQNMKAQQMIKLANMLNQTYGSQQHLVEPSQRENFGSTPHLAKPFNNAPSISNYYSRPPSRDSQHISIQQMQPMQYVNEHLPYMEPPPSMQMPPHTMQIKNMYCENPMSYGGKYMYNNDMQHGPPQMPQYAMMPAPQYVTRQTDYDDYMHANHERNSPQSNQFYLAEIPAHPVQHRQSFPVSSGYDPQPNMDYKNWQSQKLATITDGTYIWEAIPQPSTKKPLSHQNSMKNELYRVYSSPQNHPQYSNADDMDVHCRNSSSRSSNMMMLPPQTVTEANTNQLLSDEMMAPQSICFIGDEEDVEEIERDIIESLQATQVSDYGYTHQAKHKSAGSGSSEDCDNTDFYPHKLNITSGSSTYRIPSPSRPLLHANSFQDPLDEQKSKEKGFYISFNDDQPKRPKPPLRAKRSPKKEKSLEQPTTLNNNHNKSQSLSQLSNPSTNNGILHSQSFKYTTDKNHNDFDDQEKCQQRLFDVDNMEMPHSQQLHKQQQQHTSVMATRSFDTNAEHTANPSNYEVKSQAIVIGTDTSHLNSEVIDEMERRKEKIMLLSLQRRQQQEEAKARKEIEASLKREKDREAEETRTRKKEEQMARRAAILEQHRLKKAIEEAEREGKTIDRSDLTMKFPTQTNTPTRFKQQRSLRPRPKTIHVDDGSMDISDTSSISSRNKQGSSINLTADSPDEYPSTSSTPNGRGSYKSSRAPVVERGRTQSRISLSKGNRFNSRDRKSNSLMNLCDIDSGLGRATPPRRAPSPGMITLSKHMSSPSGPGSLPPGLVAKRRTFDDGSSDITSTPNSIMEYSGPKLYKQPAAKSNRGIILNAVEYCVFPGVVNRDAKQKVLEKIARSEAKHFLILFRDAGCQFRALYSYMPDASQVSKLYGTGPSQVDEIMFDKFFKYNSGGKCFSQVHTKHLTVTIDAFTIHNSLWQGKKVHLPSKKEMALVI